MIVLPSPREVLAEPRVLLSWKVIVLPDATVILAEPALEESPKRVGPLTVMVESPAVELL